MTDPYAPPEWYDPKTLVRRLYGVYAIPINDGLGPLEGEEMIDNHPHYVRRMPNQPEIQTRAAAMIRALEAGELTDSHHVLDLIEELKQPADPLNIGKPCIVPIHKEAIARLKELAGF
jgi:hypothetical protein